METPLPQADGHIPSVRGRPIHRQTGATGNALPQADGPFPSVRSRDVPAIHRGTGAAGDIPTLGSWSLSISQG